MLRTVLISAALIAATLSPAARGGDYAEVRVVSVVPHLAMSFGSLRHDGFRVDYVFGGQRYSTHSHRHPGRVILIQAPVRVEPAPYAYRYRSERGRVIRHDDHRHGWDDRGRWDDRRHWRHDDHDHDRGRGRKHGRH